MTDAGARKAGELHELVRHWTERIDSSRATVLEHWEHEEDESADYNICYEVIFKPKDPRCAWLELFVATNGGVGVCLEDLSRIPILLGGDFLSATQPDKIRRCAFGFELADLEVAEIEALIEIVARARFFVSTIYFSKYFNLRRAVIQEQEFKKIGRNRPLTRIFSSAGYGVRLSREIRYLPWISR